VLPDFLRQLIEEKFEHSISRTVGVGGGDINQAAHIVLASGRNLFVKWHWQPPPGFFSAEAHGLMLLAETQSLVVPEPLAWGDRYLIMQWLGRGRHAPSVVADALGEGLAAQHRLTARTYGLDRDNYCGPTPQRNEQTGDWANFFATRRLGVQLELAAERDRLPKPRRQKLEKLIDKLADLLPARPPASLLHGDLWGGNWLVTADNRPALIDPAVYYGHRETDLAFTELFGGFPTRFYQAYEAVWPLEAGYGERKQIYNLYHLLNHLNLFGERYGHSVDAVLNRYG
jgi:fructosamine-3-kinase